MLQIETRPQHTGMLPTIDTDTAKYRKNIGKLIPINGKNLFSKYFLMFLNTFSVLDRAIKSQNYYI